eukprot:7493853-Ditylum_brightwellii.AAC.1
MGMPDGFYYKDSDSTNKFVFGPQRNLYGLKQASYNWIKLFKAGLLAQGDDATNREISLLKSAGFDLTDKKDIKAFLGIQMSREENNNITMTQPALIEIIIKLLKLENDFKQHDTPAISPLLQPYKDAQKSDESWDYRSAIGLLTYLARNT